MSIVALDAWVLESLRRDSRVFCFSAGPLPLLEALLFGFASWTEVNF